MKLLKALGRQEKVTNDPDLLEISRLNDRAFTRRREGGMGFPEAISFLLDMCKTTLQSRLNRFYGNVKGGDPISQQAFSKLRAQFDHTPFEVMLRDLVEEEYSGRYKVATWRGYHVLADDGSYLQLPMAPELAEQYGVRGPGERPSAGISVLFDVLHGWALDPIITHTDMNEREQLKKHVAYLCGNLPDIAEKALLLLDRGYPSQEVFTLLEENGLRFCARCKNNFTSEILRAPLGSSVVTLKSGQTLRVVKFHIGNTLETLITNLFDLHVTDFPALYAMRWGIETMYHQLKRIICVEKFSGKTPNAIRQDFWASMVILNDAAILKKEADEAVAARQKTKNNKHFYTARNSDLIVLMRDRFIFAALCGRPAFTKLNFHIVMKELARAVSPVRPNRRFTRNHKPGAAANSQLKSCL